MKICVNTCFARRQAVMAMSVCFLQDVPTAGICGFKRAVSLLPHCALLSLAVETFR